MKSKILSVLSVLIAVLMSTAALTGCNKTPAGDELSGGSGESMSTEQGGEPSVSESAAESGEIEKDLPPVITPPDENGRFAKIDYETWNKYYAALEWQKPSYEANAADISHFMDDEDSAAKLKEAYPEISDWEIVFEKDFYEVGLGYDSGKQTFVSANLPVRLVVLSTKQGDGFDIVFASSKHCINFDYEYNEESGTDYAVPYAEVIFKTHTASKGAIDGIDFSNAQVYAPDIYLEDIQYVIWLPEISSVIIMDDGKPLIVKFEGETEPVMLYDLRSTRNWYKSPGDKRASVSESRKNDCIIISRNDDTWENFKLWYYSAADGTARMFEGVDSFYTLSNLFVSDACMEVYTGKDGIFRYYDFSDGADPTKCVWTLGGNGGGLMGGKVIDVSNYSSLIDKNNADRLVILYSEDENNMYWICSYTLEEGVKTNFCLDLPADGIIGSCNVRSGVAYFSYYPAPYDIDNRINYAVDVRPDRDHTIQANAW